MEVTPVDEILDPSRPLGQAVPAERPSLAQRAEQLRRQAEELLFRWDDFKQHHRLRPSRFLAAALLVGAVSTAVALYTPGYTVLVDGQKLGVVSDTDQFEAIQAKVEDQVSEILGQEYDLSEHVRYRWGVYNKREFSSLSGFESYLFSQVSQVTPAYVLTVGGQTIAAQQSSQELDALLASLKAPYVNSNTIRSEFTRPIAIHRDYVSVSELSGDLDEAASLLTSNTVEAVTYTVQSGDTAGAIAQRQGMELSALMAMNPGVNADQLSIGQELTVSQSVPYLGVRTVDRVTYRETVAPPVEYVDDENMYEGDTKVLDPGAEGANLVTARITYLSGVEEARQITSSQELVAPKTKVVAQGTKPRPKTMPKGYFIWPVSGRITSRFGGRSIFGSYNYHGAIDIAVPHGTSIKAADGGTVTTATTKGSYGKYIIIDHGGGKSTLYAHNSQLLVSAGDKVYQGQVIARAGSTGRSTGPHCHFEVRIGGQQVNPLSYLP